MLKIKNKMKEGLGERAGYVYRTKPQMHDQDAVVVLKIGKQYLGGVEGKGGRCLQAPTPNA